MSSYNILFGKKFAKQFVNYPIEDKEKIYNFYRIYKQYGLDNFDVYEGKISPSWIGLVHESTTYAYARQNHLWHYHVGMPTFVVRHNKYKTSDYVLHFQWKDKGNEIKVIDYCYHYTEIGDFYLPDETYLADEVSG